MIGLKTMLVLSLSAIALASGYQGERDQDAYLESLLKRLLDLQARGAAEPSPADDLVAKKVMQMWHQGNQCPKLGSGEGQTSAVCKTKWRRCRGGKMECGNRHLQIDQYM